MTRYLTKLAVLLLLIAPSANGQKLKVAVVDFNYLAINYYVYQQAKEEEMIDLEDIKKEDFGRQKRIKALEDEIALLVNDVEDPSLSATRRQGAAQQVEERKKAYKILISERDMFLKDREKGLAQKMATLQQEINGEVAQAVREYAATQEVDFVFDETGQSLQRTPFLIYVRNRIDLTDAVLKILNKDAPKKEEE